MALVGRTEVTDGHGTKLEMRSSLRTEQSINSH